MHKGVSILFLGIYGNSFKTSDPRVSRTCLAKQRQVVRGLPAFLNQGFETRSLPRSLAAARRGFAFYVADPSAPLKLAPFPIDSCAPAHFDLSVCPSMSLAAPRLHSLAATLCGFTFYLACSHQLDSQMARIRGCRLQSRRDGGN
jgi:hypothetical protein